LTPKPVCLYRLVCCLEIHANYSIDALDKVKGEQDSRIRRLLPPLIGVIVTPLSAAALHEVLTAQAADSDGTKSTESDH